jgi:hypothetical protein
MKLRKVPILLGVLVLIISNLACVASGGGPPSLTNPRMSTGFDGANTTTVYSPSDIFYAVADLSNVETGSVVDAKWYIVSSPDYNAGEIESSTLKIEDKNAANYESFKLSSKNSWPVGEYKVELYLDGTLVHTLNFSVK